MISIQFIQFRSAGEVNATKMSCRGLIKTIMFFVNFIFSVCNYAIYTYV